MQVVDVGGGPRKHWLGEWRSETEKERKSIQFLLWTSFCVDVTLTSVRIQSIGKWHLVCILTVCQHHMRCAPLTLSLVVCSQEFLLAQLSSLTAWLLWGWVSLSQLLCQFFWFTGCSKVLWWVNRTWLIIQDSLDFLSYSQIYATYLLLPHFASSWEPWQGWLNLPCVHSHLCWEVLLPPWALPRVLSALGIPAHMGFIKERRQDVELLFSAIHHHIADLTT